MANCQKQNLQSTCLVLNHDSFNILALFFTLLKFYIQWNINVYVNHDSHCWGGTTSGYSSIKKQQLSNPSFLWDSIVSKVVFMDLNNDPESSTWASTMSLTKARQTNANHCHCSQGWHHSCLKLRQIKKHFPEDLISLMCQG